MFVYIVYMDVMCSLIPCCIPTLHILSDVLFSKITELTCKALPSGTLAKDKVNEKRCQLSGN